MVDYRKSHRKRISIKILRKVCFSINKTVEITYKLEFLVKPLSRKSRNKSNSIDKVSNSITFQKSINSSLKKLFVSIFSFRFFCICKEL